MLSATPPWVRAGPTAASTPRRGQGGLALPRLRAVTRHRGGLRSAAFIWREMAPARLQVFPTRARRCSPVWKLLALSSRGGRQPPSGGGGKSLGNARVGAAMDPPRCRDGWLPWNSIGHPSESTYRPGPRVGRGWPRGRGAACRPALGPRWAEQPLIQQHGARHPPRGALGRPVADTSPAVLGDKAAQKKEAPALTVEEKGKRSHAARS